MTNISDAARQSLMAEVVLTVQFVLLGDRTANQLEGLRKCLELFNQDQLFKIKHLSPRVYMYYEPLEMLKLSTRTRNALRAAFGMELVGELVQRQERELLQIRNFGPICLRQVLRQLRPHGLRLGMTLEGKTIENLEAAKKAYGRTRP